ncbi:helix-turn-helix transcriptional regulator [Rhizobium leguminosarum]|uniref:helix-turn-helix domain-containing protein n=1 Tax=Rhizobium leguminosarum TaxID=384 RepID=UPI001C9282E5|nr:helix-turn-helix transcriptional regulator [Rhizobium leguminosarum]MBY2993800.1 helix-turn-helix transcriptional regulator [Rhizobium leguminosarum]MBY3055250.1 helix-turn-helix transcriptional regulator [Rhizobium leguminosarum]
MSYRMQIDAKSKNAGRFVRRVQKELQTALSRSGLRQQQVAERLGVDRSIINRRLSGHANLTLRSIADLAWAMDHHVEFSLKPKTVVVTANEHPKIAAPTYMAPVIMQAAATSQGGRITYRAAQVPELTAPATAVPSRNSVSSNVVHQHESA